MSLGGYTGEGLLPLSSCEKYNFVIKKWTVLGNLGSSKDSLTSCIIESKIFAVGSKYTKQVEVYDESTNRWTKCQSMAAPRLSFASQ